MVTFSNRLSWDTVANRLYQARQKREQSGGEILDLTLSNPTQAGFSYPEQELSEILARAARAKYEPHPLGLSSARQTLASSLGGEPGDFVLTASTSEAYSYLFKLLTTAGDSVLTAAPTYPLLDHLTALESVRLSHFYLQFHRRWTLDLPDTAEERLRAVVVVHPNNPTGSFLTEEEQEQVVSFCERNDVALISDEVFSDYRLDAPSNLAPPVAERDDVMSFSLGGLSKSAGLPHWKLAWIRVGGPPAIRRRALAALELIADSYLSVATAVQQALPELMPVAKTMSRQIAERIRGNLAVLKENCAQAKSIQLYPVEGGWSAVLRVPALATDEDLAIELLQATGVLVYPGYFFDFRGDGFLVISLLPRSVEFAQGVKHLTRFLEARVR